MVEDASRSLYKRQHRLSVLGYVAFSPTGVVFAREIARTLGIGDNQVSPDFDAMRALGALEFVETHDREQWHRRVDHPIWPFTRQLLQHLASKQGDPRPNAILEAYLRDVLHLGPVSAATADCALDGRDDPQGTMTGV